MNATNPCLRGEKGGGKKKKKEFGGAVVPLEEISGDRGAVRTSCTPREEWGLIYVTAALFTLCLQRGRFSPPKVFPSRRGGASPGPGSSVLTRAPSPLCPALTALAALKMVLKVCPKPALPCLDCSCLVLQSPSLELQPRQEEPALS